MDKSLNFFRVFDVAFFAPGTVLFGALWYSGYLPAGCLVDKDNFVHGTLTLALAIVLIYLLGLTTHGVQRLVVDPILSKKEPRCSESTSWFNSLGKEQRDELAIYFWYMKATCWNVAVAIIPAVAICCRRPVPVVLASVVLLLLVVLGREFDKSMKKAAKH